jgi:hypothetical protein
MDKRLAFIGLSMLLLAGLPGCGGDDAKGGAPSPAPAPISPAPAPAPAPSPAPAPGPVAGCAEAASNNRTWVEISPAGITKQHPFIGAMLALVDPTRPGTLYLTTSRNGVLKSIDCGKSWTKLNTGRNGDKIDQGAVWSAALDPAGSGTLYVLTGYGPAGVWKSTNGGVDWDNVLPGNMGMPGFVARVTMNRNNPQHLLLAFHDNCTMGHTPVCFGETKDGGNTWRVIDFPTNLKNGWAEGAALLPLDENRWLFQAWELYYTGDAGRTWNQVDTGGAAVIQGPVFDAPDGSKWLASVQGMLTSRDGEHWTRVPNSYEGIEITGCGNRLYTAKGFQPPWSDGFVFSAAYADPLNWSLQQTPGLPSRMQSGATSVTCDRHHNILYVAAQGEGLWRVAVPNP